MTVHTNINYKELRKETEASGYNVKDEFKHLPMEEIQKIVADDRLPFSVMCLNITGSLNIGNIIRTSHALGAKQVFVVGRKCIDNRSIVGSDKYFPIHKIEAMQENGELDLTVITDIFLDNNLYPIYIETGGIDYRLHEWQYQVNLHKSLDYEPCLVVGNEGIGIPENLMFAETIVSIPQRGCIRSINVSSAFAIVASHMVNQIW